MEYAIMSRPKRRSTREDATITLDAALDAGAASTRTAPVDMSLTQFRCDELRLKD